MTRSVDGVSPIRFVWIRHVITCGSLTPFGEGASPHIFNPPCETVAERTSRTRLLDRAMYNQRQGEGAEFFPRTSLKFVRIRLASDHWHPSQSHPTRWTDNQGRLVSPAVRSTCYSTAHQELNWQGRQRRLCWTMGKRAAIGVAPGLPTSGQQLGRRSGGPIPSCRESRFRVCFHPAGLWRHVRYKAAPPFAGMGCTTTVLLKGISIGGGSLVQMKVAGLVVC